MALDKLTSNDALKNWRLKINDLIDEVDRRAPTNHAVNDLKHGIGTGEVYGHVKLIDEANAVYDSTSGIAASPLSVKTVYDIAKGAIQKGVPIDGVVEADSFIGNLQGKADEAYISDKAISDENGNNIVETYATKQEIINGITYSGSLKRDGENIQWRDILTDVGVNASFLYQSTCKGYMPALNLPTTNGRVGFGTNETLCRWDYFKETNSTNVPDSYIDLTPTSINIKGDLTVNDGKVIIGTISNINYDNMELFNVGGSIIATGDITGDRVFNAWWNDYAEFFEKGQETEVGDFIALDESSEEEKYVKATKGKNDFVVGVHSNTYGHILGGRDTIEESEKTYIPVGLVGRVYAKITGEIKKGDYVVLSNIPGVGRKYYPDLDDAIDIIGGAVESSNDKEIKLVKIKLK